MEIVNEIIKNLGEIPINAYLLVVIALQYWQGRNRDTMWAKMIADITNKNEQGMGKISVALTNVGNALTEVATIVKLKDK